MATKLKEKLIQLYTNYKDIKYELSNTIDNELGEYNSNILFGLDHPCIYDKEDFVNFCNQMKNIINPSSSKLSGIEKLVTRGWMDAWSSGKFYADSLEVLTKTKFGLYLVPFDDSVDEFKFKQNRGDILMGFYASANTTTLNTKVSVFADDIILAEDNIKRGHKVLLDQPIPLIALQLTKVSVMAKDRGIYAICGSFSDNKYRTQLVQESYNWGKWHYSKGKVQEAIPDEKVQVISINIEDKYRDFGGDMYKFEYNEDGQLIKDKN